jgi:hypothetical protein
MAVLGAGLAREEHQLFGADARGIDVDDQSESCSLELAQAEVGHLDRRRLSRRQHDARTAKILAGALPRLGHLFFRQHRKPPLRTLSGGYRSASAHAAVADRTLAGALPARAIARLSLRRHRESLPSLWHLS